VIEDSASPPEEEPGIAFVKLSQAGEICREEATIETGVKYNPRVPCEEPPDFGGKFERLQLAEGVSPFGPIHPGALTNDYATGREPETSMGIFVNLDADPELEIVESAVSCDSSPRAMDVDFSTGLMTPLTSVSLPQKGAIMAAADLDRDGQQDFIIGQYPFQIYWGGRGIRDESGTTPKDSRCWLAHAVGLEDVDKDGWLDVLLFSMQCWEDFVVGPGAAIYINLGGGKFEDRTDEMMDGASETASYAGYLTKLGDDEELLVTAPIRCGGIGAHNFFKQMTDDDEGYPTFSEFYPTEGVPGFRSLIMKADQDKPFNYFALMGMASSDINRDGNYEVIFATHPLFLLIGKEGETFVDYSTEISMLNIPAPETSFDQFGWGMAWLDLNWDGLPEFLTANGPDFVPFEPGHPENMGPQQVVARWNAGNMAFGDVSETLGFDEYGEFRAMTVGDMDVDGDPDLIIGVMAEAPWVYQNNLKAGEGLSLRLEGTTSNQFARGGEVFLMNEEGMATHRFQVSNQAGPNAVSEHLLFLPSTSPGSVDRIRVRWPTGIEQDIGNLKTGMQHTIAEPESIIISPASRRLEEGEKSFTVEIIPRNLDGSINTESIEVSLSLTFGAANIEKQEVPGKHVFQVEATEELGSAILEAQIGTKKLQVRPRVFFEP